MNSDVPIVNRTTKPLGRRASRPWAALVASHTFLIAYCLLCLFPVLVVVFNWFKVPLAIFGQPFVPPTPDTFTLDGYKTLAQNANFGLYTFNSLFVTVGSLAVILLAGAAAAFALSEYRFRFSTLLSLYLSLGIMVPIRLGTPGILELAKALNINAVGLDCGLRRPGPTAGHLRVNLFYAPASQRPQGSRPPGRGQRVPHLLIGIAADSPRHRRNHGHLDDSGVERPMVSADSGQW